jgi:hypothetical protein
MCPLVAGHPHIAEFSSHRRDVAPNVKQPEETRPSPRPCRSGASGVGRPPQPDAASGTQYPGRPPPPPPPPESCPHDPATERTVPAG